MNKEINQIIQSYLDSKNSDYALLLSGPWGCGKTFYIQNELKDIIENKDNNKDFIYISLNGISDFSKIKQKIVYYLLSKEATEKITKKNPKILSKETAKSITGFDIDMIDSIFDIAEKLPKVGFISTILLHAKKTFIENKANIDYSKVFFVFDDLERMAKSADHGIFLGLIFENFVKKGAKTLFIADEEKLDNDEEYKKIKEKVIRRTIVYEPEFNAQISTFLKAKYSDQEIYFKKKIDLFIFLLKNIKIKNLRTISIIFDNFFHIKKKLKEDIFNKHDEFLFNNIMILAKEFIVGNITIKDKDSKKDLNQLGKHLFNYDMFLNKTKEDKETYPEEFYKKYVENSYPEFIFVDSLFTYTITGFFDYQKCEKEIISIFYKTSPEEEQVISTLQKWREIEEKEFEKASTILIENLKKGVYNLSRFAYLYSLLLFYKEECNMDYSVGESLEEIFLIAIDETSKHEDKIPVNDESHFIMPESLFYQLDKNDKVYKIIRNKVDRIINNRTLEAETEQIEKILTLVIAKDESAFDLFRKYDRTKFFRDIIATKNLAKFNDFNNASISYFEAMVKNNILQISNAGEHYYGEKSALEEIKNYIGIISKNIQSNMRKKRFEDLIHIINDAICHLEKTKPPLV